MSKKIGLIAILTVILVLAVTGWAFAAQNAVFNGSNNGFNDFAATPKVFNADGNANYPNEIYLPNETNTAAYRIHSNYSATTDACASCHSTHTAVGEALLQWGTVYDTCMACHDGTVTTTYNVADGQIGTTGKPTAAGLFGHSDDASQSSHNVSGALSVYAAPGGPGTAGLEVTAPWDAEFSCASCHTPHGQGGNARLLNPDVNGAAKAVFNSGASKGVTLKDGGGYFYSDYNNDNINEVWLSGHGYTTNVYDGSGATALATTKYTLDSKAGFSKVVFNQGYAPVGTVKADFVPAITVRMNISNALTANESEQHVAGLNAFCGACHKDYDTTNVSGPDSNLNGTYTEAYRHKVGFDRTKSLATLTPLNMKLEANNGKNNVTCETCHVAHGTTSAYWVQTLKNANGGNLPAGFEAANLVEAAGSSALKRLPNMAVCEACHAKGKASEAYGANNGGAITPVSNVTSNAAGGGYVGQTTCEGCHGDQSKHYNETWHPDISRPGLTKKVATQAAAQDQASLDAIVPGFAQAIKDTQVEIEKVGYDDKGRLKLDPASWANKGVNAANVKVWSTGTDSGQEIMVRGSVINQAADNWYIVAILDGTGKIVTTGVVPEDYGCGTRGCHTTGYFKGTNNLTGASSDFTLWVNAAATGTKVPFELGVTCEACHGQGGNHVQAPSASNIINPAKAELKVQTVGQQSDGHGNFAAFDSNKAYIDIVGGNGNAWACAKCHNGGHHQGDYYSIPSTKEYPALDTNIHFTRDIASCITCHNSHEESADPAQLSKPTIAQTCQQCHDTEGTRNPDGTVKGLTFEPGSTTRILHNFPSAN